MTLWPEKTLAAVPEWHVASDLAAEVRAAVTRPQDAGRLHVARSCEAANAEVRIAPLRGDSLHHQAMLLPQADGGFRIVIDPAVQADAATYQAGRHRMRFRLAHELGHTFFYDRGRRRPERTLPPSRQEEVFCHRFATSLLVPMDAAASTCISPQSLRHIAGVYDVSTRVAAWATVYAQPGLEIVFLRLAEHPSRGGSVAMRVQWAASERFVARGESFKSSLADLQRNEHARRVEEFTFGGSRRRMLVDAHGFGACMLVFLRPAPERSSLGEATWSSDGQGRFLLDAALPASRQMSLV